MTQEAAEGQRPPVLTLFESLLRINSASGQEGEIARYLADRLRALGFTVEVDGAGNVIGFGAGEGEALLLCAHMDTVEPTPDLKIVHDNGIIRSDGTTILGADDKAGIATILEAVRQAKRRPPIDVVFTVREETGLVGANALDLSHLRAHRGYVLDSGGPIGSLTTAAPSQRRLTARVLGKAAHAGVCPEKGVSAIVAASQAIVRMKLGRIDDETTANVGVIQGGRATNIVCDLVELRAEARSHSETKLVAQIASMRAALEAAVAEMGAAVEIVEERNYTAFHVPDEHPLVQAAIDTAEAMGFAGSTHSSGGGSDANVFNLAGLECINFSVGMEGAHGKDEYIAEQSLTDATRLLTALLERLAG
ncbi:MAG: M20/M25/M40 family metallo-hydrolase [Anaerolineae bacterium]